MKRPPCIDPTLPEPYEYAPVDKPRELPKNCRRSSRLASKVTSNPETSTSSQPQRKKRKPNRKDGISFPSLRGIDDPKKRRKILKKHYKRWNASMQPKWLPSTPTAAESFIHELPVDVQPVRRPLNDLERELVEAYNNCPLHSMEESEDDLDESMDDLINEFAVSSRTSRRYDAEDFRRSYVYGFNNSMDEKTCIWSSGIYTWPEKSSGHMWIAVHGMNSVCVVARNEALDVTRQGNSLKVFKKWHVHQQFLETLISEMEDLADPSSEARQNNHQSFDKPFAVVSLIPVGTNKANEECGTEASGAVYDGKRAINFLREKMEIGSALTYGYSETLQMAVSAFLLLFDKELKAKDIKVCVWAKGLGTARHLLIRDAEQNLVVMYEPGTETLVERVPK